MKGVWFRSTNQLAAFDNHVCSREPVWIPGKHDASARALLVRSRWLWALDLVRGR